MLLDRPLETITETDLEALIANGEAEQQTIDYKKALVFSGGDPPRNEFRKDIISFANASGGHLVIGMDEDRGFPTDLCGQDIPDPDAFKLQIESVLQTKIAPRVPGVGIRMIHLASGRYAVVIRIPRSFNKPHQMTIGTDDFQFWARNSAGKYRLSVEELRSVILQSETVAERIRQFRMDRIGSVLSETTPVSLAQGPTIIIHVVPLSAFDPQLRLDMASIERLSVSGDPMLSRLITDRGRFSTTSRYNLDGYLTYHRTTNSSISEGYCQIYRSGIFEFIDASLMSLTNGGWSYLVESALIAAVERCFNLLEKLEVPAPAALMMTLLRAENLQIERSPYGLFSSYTKFGQSNLLIPEVIVDDYKTPAHTALHAIFDMVWNAGDQPSCENYDANGMHRQFKPS